MDQNEGRRKRGRPRKYDNKQDAQAAASRAYRERLRSTQTQESAGFQIILDGPLPRERRLERPASVPLSPPPPQQQRIRTLGKESQEENRRTIKRITEKDVEVRIAI
jgi:hypothetical protein